MSNGSGISLDEREREIFLEALEKAEPGERARFLEAACGKDEVLRTRVLELIRAREDAEAFLETPALSDPRGAAPHGAQEPGATTYLLPVSEQPGDRIGRYKLLQKIGEGGCGVVYMAEQEEPVRRRVALKIIKLGMDTKSVIARFEAERQALAMMDHPNIAKVFDAGATEAGRPFFVMELVRGIKITEYCDQANLSTQQRLNLFIEVCQAIQHAHQKGVIHRDIKPSNILVTMHDGVPVPKVIDFGIAKATEQRLTERTLFTEFTAFIGTPAYMSPEQAEMSGLDIDTRSDIYSLGVLLYELLTGKTPFDAEKLLQAGLDECRRTIREQEPVRPSTRLATMVALELTTTARQRCTEAPRLIHLLQGDLDWIVMKCLEKDRSRRYDTANDLALDVHRYLDDEPVLARPPSNLYRLQKMLHRHRGVVAATGAVAATLLIGAGVSIWQAVRATQAEHEAQLAQRMEAQLRLDAQRETRRAEAERAKARLNEYVADITVAQARLAEGNYGRVLQVLNRHRPTPPDDDLRGFEWRYLWKQAQGDAPDAFPTQEGAVQAVAVSPDTRWIAIGLREKLNVWDTRTRSLVVQKAKGVVSMAFLPDGSALVTGSPAAVHVWRTRDWTEVASLPGCAGAVALSPDGSRLAAEEERPFPGRHPGAVHIWDTATWSEVRVLPGVNGPMAFSPDGQKLAVDGPAGLGIWNLATAEPPLVLQESTNLFMRAGPWFRNDRIVSFTKDGKKLVAPRNTLSRRGVFVLSIWDADSGKETDVLPEDPQHVEHTGAISALAFSPDGNTLATASWDHSIRLWDFAKRQRLRTLHGHLNEVWAMAFTADGKTIVSGAKDGGVKLWSTEPKPAQDLVEGSLEPLAFSPDGHTLATLSREGVIAFLNVATHEPEQKWLLDEPRQRGPFRPPPRPAVAVSADLLRLALGTDDGGVRIWNTKTGETNHVQAANRRIDWLVFSPDGSLLITGGRGLPLAWLDLRNDRTGVIAPDGHRATFSPDGRTLAFSQREPGVQLWDAASRTLRGKLATETGVFALAFSPDGRRLATSAGPEDIDNAIRLWDLETGNACGIFTGHKQAVWSIAFAPDGKTLATTSDDSTLRFWNVATQQELLTIRRLGGGLRNLLFSPDNRLLVGESGFFTEQSALRFFQAPSMAEIEEAGAQQARALK